MRTIINFVTKKAQKHGGDNTANWIKTLAAPSTGLFISRRLGNMPDAMAPHLLGTIVSELQALSKHFDEWRLSHFVVITQGYTVEKDHDNERANAPAKKQKAETEEIYEMLEDQLFAEIAIAELRWGGERSYSFGTYTDMFNVIFLVPTNKLQYAIDKMTAMFQEQ